MTPAESGRLATIEGRVPRTLERARKAGVEIGYVGVSGMFHEHRVYAGDKTDWVFGPADDLEALVPRAQYEALERLNEAGLRFPAIFIAHEIRKDLVPVPPARADGPIATVGWAEAATLVGPTPPPAESVELGHRLNESARLVLGGAVKAIKLGAVVAAAPLMLVGAAAGALASGLDPIVIGAIPAVGSRDGDPAAWFVLVRWEW